MRAGSVAGWVRGRALLRRRLGVERARRLAGCARLDDALVLLETSPYGRDLEPGMDLAGAQRAVWSTLLWHLRVLAGWEPQAMVEQIRVLAAGFEIDNVIGHVTVLDGRPAPPPYTLGSLASAWGAVRRTATVADARRALAASSWRDPGGSAPGEVLIAMQVAWCRRVFDEVPTAGPWARQAAALLRANLSAYGGELPGAGAGRDLHRIAGAPEPGDEREGGDPWSAQARWWRRVEASSRDLAGRSDAGPACTVGVVGLMAADAWRTGAALAMAGREPDQATWEVVFDGSP